MIKYFCDICEEEEETLNKFEYRWTDEDGPQEMEKEICNVCNHKIMYAACIEIVRLEDKRGEQ